MHRFTKEISWPPCGSTIKSALHYNNITWSSNLHLHEIFQFNRKVGRLLLELIQAAIQTQVKLKY